MGLFPHDVEDDSDGGSLHDVEFGEGSIVLVFDRALAADDSDDDDPVERNEYEIEVDLTGYDEEPRIKHNEYPDTESDGEEVLGRRRRRGFEQRSISEELFLGQTFFNGVAFKEAILDYALKTKTNIKHVRFDKTRLAFRCIGSLKCRWRVYCAVSSKTGLWKVRKYNGTHCCVPNGECYMFKVPKIARLFLECIRDDPDGYMPKKIEDTIIDRWGVVVTRNQCQSARGKALKWIEKEYDEQFKRIKDYANEILDSNHGSTVEVDCQTNKAGEDVFNMFYVCFEVLKRKWKQTCRPLISIDGAFMRGKMKGQVLSAIGRDADNRIFPVAWGVVGVENTDNWAWFIKKLTADLSLGQGAGAAIVSDRQKGLIKAVKAELPEIEHRMCVRHIYGNLKEKHGKKTQMKPFICNLAWIYNKVKYYQNLDRLFNYDSVVHRDVVNQNPMSWCRAFYAMDGKNCEDVDNNSVESFNKSIDKAREKPFIQMMETIRIMAMERIAKRSAKSEKHDGSCTPYAMEFLSLEEYLAKKCTIKPSTNGQYEAIISGCFYRVHFQDKTCTCMKWNITGIPCEHAYGVITHRKMKVKDFVSRWFKTSLWRKTYEEGISPLRGANYWPRSSQPLVHKPPYVDKKSKKEKRKKGKNE